MQRETGELAYVSEAYTLQRKRTRAIRGRPHCTGTRVRTRTHRHARTHRPTIATWALSAPYIFIPSVQRFTLHIFVLDDVTMGDVRPSVKCREWEKSCVRAWVQGNNTYDSQLLSLAPSQISHSLSKGMGHSLFIRFRIGLVLLLWPKPLPLRL